STGWYDPARDSRPSPAAFRPTQHDISGLSVSRAKYRSAEQAGRSVEGAAGRRFFSVAVLRVGDLRAAGLDIAPRPIPPDDLGHAEITNLTYADRRSDRSLEW